MYYSLGYILLIDFSHLFKAEQAHFSTRVGIGENCAANIGIRSRERMINNLISLRAVENF